MLSMAKPCTLLGGGFVHPNFFCKWCVLVYILIKFYPEKISKYKFFLVRNNDISCAHARGFPAFMP